MSTRTDGSPPENVHGACSIHLPSSTSYRRPPPYTDTMRACAEPLSPALFAVASLCFCSLSRRPQPCTISRSTTASSYRKLHVTPRVYQYPRARLAYRLPTFSAYTAQAESGLPCVMAVRDLPKTSVLALALLHMLRSTIFPFGEGDLYLCLPADASFLSCGYSTCSGPPQECDIISVF